MSLSSHHVTLAQARRNLETGNLGEVERVCQQLLKQNKADADALHMLGAVALQRGSLDQAQDYYSRAIKVRSSEPSLHVNLGKTLLRQGKAQEAIKSFDAALKLKPEMDMAAAGKAESLNYLGEAQQARAVLEPLVRSGADGPETAFVYGTMLTQAGENRAAVELFNRHLATHAVEGLQRYRMGLMLGQACEALGEFEHAFDAYSKANAAGAVLSRFKPAEYSARFNRIITFFGRERLEQLSRFGSESELPIFIVGMPRSGSTLIEQIIQSHPQVFGAGEVPFMEQLPATISQQLNSQEAYPECLAQFDKQAAGRLSHAYLSPLRALNRHVLRILDKNLLNFEHIGLISLLFPKSRIIHCLRDVRDTCLSCFTSPLSPIKHGYSTNLEQLGSFFCEYQRLMAHWRTVPTTPILEVQYEELVANQEQMSQRIIEFCGLPWDDKCLKYYESKRVVRTLSYDQVRRPIYDKSIGRAKNFAAHLKPLEAAIHSGVG